MTAPNTSSGLPGAATLTVEAGRPCHPDAPSRAIRGTGGGRPSTTCGLDHCDEPARLFPCGWRCPTHVPGPVPVPDPALTLDGLRTAAGLPTHVVPGNSASWAAVDAKAIASGRRRSRPGEYLLARHELEQQAATRAAAGGGR